MPDLASLARDFDYDLWANRRWLACLVSKQLPEPDTEVFAHILSAQQIWLTRVQGESPSKMPKVEPTESESARLHSGWKDVILNTTGDREISYRRTTGEELTTWLSDIAHHVVNHGTYHRGELRGLCRSRSDDDFPESDFGGFLFMKPREV
jgi:uncharacterized damage-inducible protein DinB